MSLRNINIASRAFISFALIAALILTLGVLALTQMSRTHATGENLSSGRVPNIRSLDEFALLGLRLRVEAYQLLIEREPDAQQKIFTRFQGLRQQLDSVQASYEKLIASPEERSAYDQLVQSLNQYRQLEGRMKSYSQANQVEALRVLLQTDLVATVDGINKIIGRLQEINVQQVSQANQRAMHEYSAAFTQVSFLLIITTVLTLLLAWLLTRSITRPLAWALNAAEETAKGNLSQPIVHNGDDEVARLLRAMSKMQENLRGTLQKISSSATQLASAAEELNCVTDESARSLVQQNHEIEQAATAVNQMTIAVEEVARNAVSTSEASMKATTSTGEGRERVQKTVDAMELMMVDVEGMSTIIGNLERESRDISKVLDVIRGLADQTNLLALNAAIEAARAGEAGRGFAVVADEVRALAHRTQQSTSEIERMIGSIQGSAEFAVSSIGNSSGGVEGTLNISKAAGMALEEINTSIIEINERNLVIASAAEEQAQVAREVDRNLVNIRDLSVQSATGASQTSAASNELSRLALELNNMVARFSL